MDEPLTPQQVRDVLLTMELTPTWKELVGRFLHRKVENFTPENYDDVRYSARDLNHLISEFIETYYEVIRNPNSIRLKDAERKYGQI